MTQAVNMFISADAQIPGSWVKVSRQKKSLEHRECTLFLIREYIFIIVMSNLREIESNYNWYKLSKILAYI